MVDNLETFKYPETNEIKTIRNSDLGKLKIWIAYLEFCIAQNTPITMDEEVLYVNLHTISFVKAQDCSEVGDTHYIPHTPNEQAAFTQKQIYLYSVFCHTLLTIKTISRL